MKHNPIYDVVIMGSGVAGLAGAVYCGRLNLKTVVIGKEKGGTITKTNIVENYPGFKSISGLELFERIFRHADEYGLEFVNEEVLKIIKGKEGCLKVYTKGKHFHTKAILFATGSKWRKLNIKGEKEFKNKGIHTCALCDGPFYKNKEVMVIGGGDSAAKEALLLTKYAKKVYIIARSKLRPEPINMKRVKEEEIEVIEDTNVLEIRGEKFVDSVLLDKKYKNSDILSVNGVFVDIGHIPLSELAEKIGVKLNKNKEIIIDKESRTNLKGIYAAGDVTDTKFKQAITGVGEAVKAVYSIYEYITHEKIICSLVYEE